MSSDGALETTFSESQLETGRKLFAGQCTFIMGVAEIEQLPAPMNCEVAFAGRSNVGKSSLLNALTGHNALARTSNTPGRTRELNYFNINDALFLVDMPGYGYARAERKLIEQWNILIRDYLRGRAALRRVFILIDARHGFKSSDLEMMDMLDETAVTYQIVLTKADKMKPGPLAEIVAGVEAGLAKRPAAHPEIHLTSSVKGVGIPHLRAEIAMLAGL
ncbi:MAG: ribosome biogenesis GTP-binding protein YihA/YsxC [Hyphomicrobiales bacterium]